MDISVKTATESATIVKWKVKVSSRLQVGTVLCVHKLENSGLEHKVKSDMVGTVVELLATEGTLLKAGEPMIKLQGCQHDTVMKDMCADCGKDLRESRVKDAKVAMVHAIPELVISNDEAKRLGKKDEMRLIESRKLVLLVDLDQTLLHTTNDNIPSNLQHIIHFQMRHAGRMIWYHTKLRPGTEHFLESMSKKYELHICTFGNRMYAHTIARFIDPTGKFFSHRILSRDECFSQNSKTANLKFLFPCGDHMVAIIDDREDVWMGVRNLVRVKPYRFFDGTADINAPPGVGSGDAADQAPKIKHIEHVRRVKRGKKLPPPSKPGGKKVTFAEQDDVVDAAPVTSSVEDVPPVEVGKSATTDVVVTGEDDTRGADAPPQTEQPDARQDSNSIAEKNVTTSDTETTGVTKPASIMEDDTSSQSSVTDIDVMVDMEANGTTAEACEDKQEKRTETDVKTAEIFPENVTSQSADDKITVTNAKSGDTDDVTDGDDEWEYEEELEWEDTDDYLYHLEDILSRVHAAFFELHDQALNDKDKKQNDSKSESSGNIEGTKNTTKAGSRDSEEAPPTPDLKHIIPYVQRKALRGARVVFSGVVPTNATLEHSRAYAAALALGAQVQPGLVPSGAERTTHVVAARPGTTKVHEARRTPGLYLVSPEWLWSCAQRWEWVDERLFPLAEGIPVLPPKPRHAHKRKRGSEACHPGHKRSRGSHVTQQTNKQPSETTEKISSKGGSNLPSSTEPSVVTDEPAVDTVDDDAESEESETGEESTAPGDTEDTPVPSPAAARPPRFAETLNPVLTLALGNMSDLQKEIDDELDDDSDDVTEELEAEEEQRKEERLRAKVLAAGSSSSLTSQDDSSDSENYDMAGEAPLGWSRGEQARGSRDTGLAVDREYEDEEQLGLVEEGGSPPHEVFPRHLVSDTSSEDNDSADEEGDEELVAAIERQLLR